jgi:hypothetical protein
MIDSFYEIWRGWPNQRLFYPDAIVPLFVRRPYSDEIWKIDFEDLLRCVLNNHFRDETVASILELVPGSSVLLASERF